MGGGGALIGLAKAPAGGEAIVGSSFRIARILGVDIKLDYSWLIIFGLVTWSLTSYYLPLRHPGWPAAGYLTIGVITSLLFFASVLAHELSHSVVARAQGTPVSDITLFIFGGAAHLSGAPRRPREELLMAAAGPLTSLAVAGLFGGLWWASAGTVDPLHALAGWLAWINLALAGFNLIPGFPLDGGRIFRAILWGVSGNFVTATRLAAGVGQVVAFGFIFWGVWQVFSGNWADGLWMAFIGWFLLSAAAGERQQATAAQFLSGHSVREAMMSDCPRIPPWLTLDEFVDQVVLPSGRRCFPVADGGQLAGLLTLHRLQRVPRDKWAATRVADVMIPLAELKTARPDEDLGVVFARLAAEDVNQLPVVDEGRLVGMVARDSIINFIQLHTSSGPAPRAA